MPGPSSALADVASAFCATVAPADPVLHADVVAWLTATLASSSATLESTRASVVDRLVASSVHADVLVSAIAQLRRVVTAPIDSVSELRRIDDLVDVELGAIVRRLCEVSFATQQRSSRTARVSALRTLSTGFAHELRNPVNAACLQLEMLQRELQRSKVVAPAQLDRIAAIEHELDRVSRLLDEFLAFARPGELSLGEHELSHLIAAAIAGERTTADAHGVTIEQLESMDVACGVDENKFQQMLRHLIRNAVEASEVGGRVTVALELTPGRVHVDVDDDGPGIVEPIRQRVYEPFFTTKESGTGLGLSIVHSIAAAHGGSVEMVAKPRGTRFRVSLPVRPRPLA